MIIVITIWAAQTAQQCAIHIFVHETSLRSSGDCLQGEGGSKSHRNTARSRPFYLPGPSAPQSHIIIKKHSSVTVNILNHYSMNWCLYVVLEYALFDILKPLFDTSSYIIWHFKAMIWHLKAVICAMVWRVSRTRPRVRCRLWFSRPLGRFSAKIPYRRYDCKELYHCYSNLLGWS
jgi:hypothetical protein